MREPIIVESEAHTFYVKKGESLKDASNV